MYTAAISTTSGSLQLSQGQTSKVTVDNVGSALEDTVAFMFGVAFFKLFSCVKYTPSPVLLFGLIKGLALVVIDKSDILTEESNGS